jgi:hypothetical protein
VKEVAGRDLDATTLINEIVDLARTLDDELGEIDADTPLISRFADGEDAEELIIVLGQRYPIDKPRVTDMGAYNRDLRIAPRGLFRWIAFKPLREPVVHIRDWTPRQLAEIVRSGAWPDDCAFPE